MTTGFLPTPGGAQGAHPGAVGLRLPSTEHPLDLAALEAPAARLYDLLRAPDLGALEGLVGALPVVTPDDVVDLVPGADLAGEDCGILGSGLAGDHTDWTGAGLRCARYGYLGCFQGALHVLPPLVLSDDAMRLWWLVLEPRPHRVQMAWLGPWVADLGLDVALLARGDARLVQRVAQGTAKRGFHLLLGGAPPVPARSGRVEVLVDLETPDDGDDAGPRVAAGTRLARRFGPSPGAAGTDLYGRLVDPMPARGPEETLMAGEHVRVEAAGEGEDFLVAAEAGVVRLEAGVLRVEPCLDIGGDVSYETGNLSFAGHLNVVGSVRAGHSIEAGGHLHVAGSVDSGSHLRAGGDLTLEGTAQGPRCRLEAAGDIHCGQAHGAVLVAGGDIRIRRGARRSHLVAGAQIHVVRNGTPDSGRLVGGRAEAGHQVVVHDLGDASRQETSVVVGVPPEALKELDRLRQQLDVSYQQVLRLLRLFGLQRVDVDHIRSLIRAAEGHHRRVLARRARQLGRAVQQHQEQTRCLQTQSRRLAAATDGATVRVQGRAYPGVTIQLGPHRHDLTEGVGPSVFRVVDGRLVRQ